jgi:hypothetical protein
MLKNRNGLAGPPDQCQAGRPVHLDVAGGAERAVAGPGVASLVVGGPSVRLIEESQGVAFAERGQGVSLLDPDRGAGRTGEPPVMA